MPTFSYTGSVQTYTVPSGIDRLRVTVEGAAGSGNGGRVEGILPVSPGDTVHVYVGEARDSQDASGGWPDGGVGGATSGAPTNVSAGGGGGSSQLRLNGTALADRVVVAGGGGGATTATASGVWTTDRDINPGAGGAASGGDGGDASVNSATATGGLGGSQSSGGGGGTASPGGSTGGAGSGPNGGAGGADYGGIDTDDYASGASGGGGGGYYGGGGGAVAVDASGGVEELAVSSPGGGSNYTGGLASIEAAERGVSSGDGAVVIEAVPPAPTALSIDDVTAGDVSLSWSNADSYDEVRVYRAQSPGVPTGTATPLATLAGGATTYTDETVDEGTTYHYVVVGVGNSIESEPSNEAETTTILPAPLDLAIAGVDNDGGDLSWTLQSTDETSVVVETRLVGDSQWTEQSSLPAGTESHTLSGLLNGREYECRVGAATSDATSYDLSGPATYEISITGYYVTD